MVKSDWYAAVAPEMQALAEACIAKLQQQSATPPQQPQDWSQTVRLQCSCWNCLRLYEFLQDAQQQVWQFSPSANEAVVEFQHMEG